MKKHTNSAKRLPKRINKGVAEMKATIVRKVANIKDWHDGKALKNEVK